MLIGQSKSCGCYYKNSDLHKGRNGGCWKGYGDLSGRVWGIIKANAKARNIKVSISIRYAWQIYKDQKGKCALTGVDIPLCVYKEYKGGYTKGLSAASLDRIDSSKGYIKGNLQWVHKDINKMKMNLKLQDFIKQCDMVSKYCKKKQDRN